MNYQCASLLDKTKQLKQEPVINFGRFASLIEEIEQEITEIGNSYIVADISVEDMRRNGYDVTEEDGPTLEEIAGKIDVSTALWHAIDYWAAECGIKRIENFAEDGDED